MTQQKIGKEIESYPLGFERPPLITRKPNDLIAPSESPELPTKVNPQFEKLKQGDFNENILFRLKELSDRVANPIFFFRNIYI